LHRVRNIVQHENAGADNADIPAFRTATERYTKDLVSAVFGVSLDTIMLAECVQDPTIRELIGDAEFAIAATDAATAFAKTLEAFDRARSEWHQRHRLPARTIPRVTTSLNDPFETIRRQIDALHKADADRVFAADPAELAWFEQMRSLDRLHVSLDEAERAVSFVFWWIVGWQAAVAFSVDADERRQQASEKARKVRTGSGPARIDSVDASLQTDTRDGGRTRIDYWRLRIGLRDVPETAEYEFWRKALMQVLAGAIPVRRGQPFVDEAGTVRINLAISEDAEQIIHQLHTCLEQAEDALASELSKRHQQQQDRQAREAQLAEAVSHRRAQLPSWFVGARDGWREAWVDLEVHHEAALHAYRLLTDNDLSIQSAGRGPGRITVARADAEAALDLLIASQATIEQAMKAEADELTQRASATRHFEAGLARAIAQLP